MTIPSITTAIPKRRYQFGEFTVTLLSDITSQDQDSYLYIAAVMQNGKTSPEVYITCEPVSAEEPSNFRVRVLSEQSEHTISEGHEWGNEKAFCEFALQGIKEMFELTDEKPIPLG